MILQALVQYYEAMTQKGKIAKPGWGTGKVSYSLEINDEGQLISVNYLKVEELRGKKAVSVPQSMQLPAAVKRSSGIEPNFLWDNAAYLLGICSEGKNITENTPDSQKKIERAKNCFQKCGEKHESLLKDCDNPAAQALIKFFQRWDVEKAMEHPALQEYLEDILNASNLVFEYDDEYLHEIDDICDRWQRSYNDSAGEENICLITGKKGSIAKLHPSIKGIVGAQSSGASLVSFNAPAFCSYGKEQGTNAPTSEYAAFAYGSALNYLIADRTHTFYVGDTLVLCWADSGQEEYQNIFCGFMMDDEFYTEDDYRSMMKNLAKGNPFDFQNQRVDPKCNFYVLGIAPNAARLSIRFFMTNTFGTMLQNIILHQERLKIARPSYDNREVLSTWRVLNETVNQNSKDKKPAPELAGELLRAILMDERYPVTLLNGVNLRIRADHVINRNRAAIIKAYYLKNKHIDVPMEVLTVSLNQESKNVPYNLGRLFSVLEAIQAAANPGINSTIKDKYFNSASATPSVIFPTLINLAQKHLRKIDGGLKVFYDKQMQELMAELGESFPTRLSLPGQGAFQLGYYHQTHERYQSRNKGEE